MSTPSVDLDRARGVMLGLACGDALGAPVEFESRRTIASRYPDGLRDFATGGPWNVSQGELTDDSRMAMDLARCLAQPGPVDMDDLARRFVAWVAEDPKDVGVTTRQAINYLGAGVPWDEAGARTWRERGPDASASNGSIMRCAPVALRFACDSEQRRMMSIDTSRITHADPRCTEACVALNDAIAHLLTGGDPAHLEDAACAGLTESSVIDAVRTAAGMRATDLSGRGYILNALQIPIWAVRNHSTLEDAIVSAVMIGDDTDTNAAVTGALAGALYGASAIPDRWLSLLHHREELVGLAETVATREL